MSSSRKIKSIIAFGISAACLIVLLGLFFGGYYLQSQAAGTAPSPHEQAYNGGFPVVDWEYWQSLNPDVIGWITIPNTEINYPIVQAPKNNPAKYLRCDVYGNWNIYGAIYLDADCISEGLQSPNAVIYGHNMGYGDMSMFGSVANYIDLNFAFSHAEILLQTPSWKKRMSPNFAEIVDGESLTKRTSFNDHVDFTHWYTSRLNNAVAILANQVPDEGRSIITLVTCSYNYLSNERTCVYAGA